MHIAEVVATCSSARGSTPSSLSRSKGLRDGQRFARAPWVLPVDVSPKLSTVALFHQEADGESAKEAAKRHPIQIDRVCPVRKKQALRRARLQFRQREIDRKTMTVVPRQLPERFRSVIETRIETRNGLVMMLSDPRAPCTNKQPTRTYWRSSIF